MSFVYIFKNNLFYDQLQMSSLKEAIAFVAGCSLKNSSFEFVTIHPTTHIQNSIKLNHAIMTTENNIRNQITYCENELLALERNETISDYDRKLKKEKIDSTMQSWQLALAKHIEGTEEKRL
jgi:hypothetical protein